MGSCKQAYLRLLYNPLLVFVMQQHSLLLAMHERTKRKVMHVHVCQHTSHQHALLHAMGTGILSLLGHTQTGTHHERRRRSVRRLACRVAMGAKQSQSRPEVRTTATNNNKGPVPQREECPLCCDVKDNVVPLDHVGGGPSVASHRACSDCQAKLIESNQRCPWCR